MIAPAIAGHRGRIVNLIGDGILAELGCVVEAVACAVEIQRGMSERNVAAPAERQMLLRIGVKLGLLFKSLGRQALKNIARPVEAYAIDVGRDEAGAGETHRPVVEQEINFCRTPDGARLAWAKVGHGPPLVKAAN